MSTPSGAAVVCVDVVDVLGFPDGVIEYGLPPRQLVTMVLGLPASVTGVPDSVTFERLQV